MIAWIAACKRAFRLILEEEYLCWWSITITFILNQSDKIKVYENYGAYICGFSYDGNYFVIANDGGIIVIKRGTWSEHG